jgi:hypothetical protein
METGFVRCELAHSSGEPCGAEAELIETRFTYAKVRGGNGQLAEALQQIEYHVGCPNCGEHWEIVPVMEGEAALA